MHTTAHGCTETVRESALKVDSGRKIPSRTGELNLRQRSAGSTLYRLSCIPALKMLIYCPYFAGNSVVVEKKDVAGGGDWTLATDIQDGSGQTCFA